MFILIAVSLLGLGLLSIGPKQIPTFLRILMGPAVGLISFTHLTILLAYIFGTNLISIGVSFLIILLIVIYIVWKNKDQFFSSVNFDPIFLLVSIPIILISSYVWFRQTLSPSESGLMAGGAGMYGDTAMHNAFTSRLTLGEFPIENPLFAGKTLVYPLANDFLSAILRINDLSLNLSFSLPQIIFLMGFLGIFYSFSKYCTTSRGILFASVILFLGWGVGWVFFLREWLNSNISFFDFIRIDYTHNPQYNLNFRNILTGLIWPERSFLPGLFLALLGYFNFLQFHKTNKNFYLFVNAIILGILPFWHTHAFIFMSISWFFFGIWFLFRKNSYRILPKLITCALIAILLAAPFFILFFSNHQTERFLHFSLGWMKGNENIVSFWFKNSLLVIPLSVLGFFLIKKELRWLFIPPFLVFFIANLLIFQPWDWDNVKLLTLSFVFLALLSGELLDKWTRKSKMLTGFCILLLIFSSLSGLHSIILQLKYRYVLYDNFDIDLASWVNQNTDKNDVFLIEPFPTHPVPGLAGRKVYLGYPGQLWVHGINYYSREIQNKNILAGDLLQIHALEVPVNFLVIPRRILFRADFPVVYENLKFRVIKL